MRRNEVLFWLSATALFLACAWAVSARTTTVGAAILFLAGMALLIWALFDSDHKLAGYVALGGWCALGFLGLVMGQRTSSRTVKLDMSKFQPLTPQQFDPNSPYTMQDTNGNPVAPKQEAPSGDLCARGMPGGITVEPFTAEELAGFNLIGATASQGMSGENWFNARFTSSPDSNKCLTKIEFEIVLGPVDEEYTVHASISGLSVPPGSGWTSYNGPTASFSTRHHERPELISWKVARAWGYKLPTK